MIVKKLLLCFVLVFCISCAMTNRIKARQLAEGYLQQRYTQEMKYRFTWRILAESSNYHVIFSPKNNPKIFFEVTIFSNLSEPREYMRYDGRYFVPDDYLITLFCLNLKKDLSSKIQEIWDGSISCLVAVDYQPFELNEHMELREMELYIEYEIFIYTKLLISKIDKEKEAANMLAIFKMINDSGYNPLIISFRYKINWNNNIYFRFENWHELTLSNIIEAMKQKMRREMSTN